MQCRYAGILADDESLDYLQAEHKKIIEQLAAGNTKSAGLDLKKHTSKQPIFGVRTSKTGRLLFTLIKKDNNIFLVYLGELHRHKYDKNSFMKKSKILNHFLKKNYDIKIDFTKLENDDENNFENVETDDPLNADINDMINYVKNNQNIPLKPLLFHNGNLIALTGIQEDAIQAKTPVIITGNAGSGKSLVAEEILKTPHPDEENPRLYLTSSHYLAQRMAAHIPNDPRIKNIYQTYNDLLSTLPELQGLHLVEYESFTAWWPTHLNAHKKVNKASENSHKKGNHKKNKAHRLLSAEESVFTAPCALIYEEFRRISGGEDAYLKMGQRQTIFQNQEEKKYLTIAYKTYLAHLEKIKSYDPNFFVAHLPGKYSVIIVDEAQDLSHLQWLQILKLAHQNGELRLIVLIDGHQAPFDIIPITDYLFSSLEEKLKINPTHIQLPDPYRCSKEIYDFTNQALSISTAMRGGAINKKENQPLGTHSVKNEAPVKWLESNDESHAMIREEIKKNKNELAIITTTEYELEAQKVFGTYLVFTEEKIKNIKGLEYQSIVLYKFFGPHFRKINSIIPKLDLAHFNEKNLPKTESIYRFHVPMITRLHIAITRAVLKLYVINPPEVANLENLFHYLKKDLVQSKLIEDKNQSLQTSTKETKEQITDDQPLSPEEDREESINTCRKLIFSGCSEQAKNIFMSLGESEKSFFVFENALLHRAPPPKIEQKVEKKPNIEKRIEYIKGLLNNFTEKGLKSLFEHYLLHDLLFSTLLDNNGKVLFTEIAHREDLSKKFCLFLRKHKQYKQLITPELICQPSLVTTDAKNYQPANSSFLISLASKENSISVLKELLFENNFWNEMPVRYLFDVITQPPYEGHTVFQLLTQFGDGIEIARQFFSINPQLYNHVSKVLFTEMTLNKYCEEMTAFSLMCKLSFTFDFLSQLLKNKNTVAYIKSNPEMMENALFKPGSKHVDSPAIIHLTRNAWGANLLFLLFSNADFKYLIHSKHLFNHLFVQCIFKTGEKKITHVIESLVKCICDDDCEGIKLLKLCYEQNEQIKTHLDQNRATRSKISAILCDQKILPFNSILFLIAQSKKNDSILKFTFDLIDFEILSKFFYIAELSEKNFGLSIFYVLAKKPDRHLFILELFQKHIGLAKLISLEALCYIEIESLESLESPLYYLSQTEDGKKTLTFALTLQENFDLLQKIIESILDLYNNKDLNQDTVQKKQIDIKTDDDFLAFTKLCADQQTIQPENANAIMELILNLFTKYPDMIRSINLFFNEHIKVIDDKLVQEPAIRNTRKNILRFFENQEKIHPQEKTYPQGKIVSKSLLK